MHVNNKKSCLTAPKSRKQLLSGKQHNQKSLEWEISASLSYVSVPSLCSSVCLKWVCGFPTGDRGWCVSLGREMRQQIGAEVTQTKSSLHALLTNLNHVINTIPQQRENKLHFKVFIHSNWSLLISCCCCRVVSVSSIILHHVSIAKPIYFTLVPAHKYYWPELSACLHRFSLSWIICSFELQQLLVSVN